MNKQTQNGKIEYDPPLQRYIAIEPIPIEKAKEPEEMEKLKTAATVRFAEVLASLLKDRQGEKHTIEIQEEYIEFANWTFGYRALITVSSERGLFPASSLLRKEEK